MDSQGSSGIPRKQMRVDHFPAASQHLDCGFDRHPYPPDSFSSAASSKAEQVATIRTENPSFHFSMSALLLCISLKQHLIGTYHPQTLYPLSLINGSLDEAKTSLSSSSSIGRNLSAHQSYTMVTGEALARLCPLTSTNHRAQDPSHACICVSQQYSLLILCSVLAFRTILLVLSF